MGFTRYFWIVALVALWFAVPSSDATAAECEAPDSAAGFAVDIQIEVEEPKIYNNLSKAELGTSNSHGRRSQILGTTQSGVRLSLKTQDKYLQNRDGYCFWVEQAVVKLSYHQLDVHIASDYQPLSCQYEAVLDHEREHVAVAQGIMQPYKQQISAALTTLSIPTRDIPSHADSPEEVRATIKQVFEDALYPVIERMNQVMAERQAEVDTIENYRRTWRRCRSW